MTPRFLIPLVAALGFAGAPLQAGMEEDWTAIVALDSGPKKHPSSPEEARDLARAHLTIQEHQLEDFLKKYPQSPHYFDARKKLALVWAAEGSFDSSPALTEKALKTLGELESFPGASFDQQADAAFLRASVQMQVQKGEPHEVRDAVVKIARDFSAHYPTDRRSPRLLVEASTLCDDSPELKRQLLDQALRETREEALKRRIEDDYRRLAFLNKPFTLRFTSTTGKSVDLADLHGKIVVLIFWSSESPHSLLWLRDFLIAYETLPKENLSVVTISLDDNRNALMARLKNLPPAWPTYFDAKGWKGPVPRSLGINALPSVWILDKNGIVRTINAKSNYESWIRRLTAE